MFGRRKIATLVGEFLGAGVLTLLILSVQRSTIGLPLFVAAAAGLTVALLTYVIGPTSGANFNPALTLGMWTIRRIPTITAILYIAVQLLGGWAAYAVYTYFVNNTLQPVGGHFTGRILAAEAFGAGIFAFGWAAAYYQRLSVGSMAAFAGVAYMVGIVAASPAAIGLLNPAVALGVRAWVWGTYVLGPVLGALVGVNLYRYMFADSEAVAAVEAPDAVVASSAAAARPSVTEDVEEEPVVTTRTRKPRAARATTAKSTTRRKTTTRTRNTRKAS